MFGITWYAGCEACFAVKSVEECRSAIKKICSMEQETVKLNKLRFIAYFQDRLLRCVNKRGFAQKGMLDYEILKTNLTNGIVHSVEMHNL